MPHFGGTEGADRERGGSDFVGYGRVGRSDVEREILGNFSASPAINKQQDAAHLRRQINVQHSTAGSVTRRARIDGLDAENLAASGAGQRRGIVACGRRRNDSAGGAQNELSSRAIGIRAIVPVGQRRQAGGAAEAGAEDAEPPRNAADNDAVGQVDANANLVKPLKLRGNAGLTIPKRNLAVRFGNEAAGGHAKDLQERAGTSRQVAGKQVAQNAALSQLGKTRAGQSVVQTKERSDEEGHRVGTKLDAVYDGEDRKVDGAHLKIGRKRGGSSVSGERHASDETALTELTGERGRVDVGRGKEERRAICKPVYAARSLERDGLSRDDRRAAAREGPETGAGFQEPQPVYDRRRQRTVVGRNEPPPIPADGACRPFEHCCTALPFAETPGLPIARGILCGWILPVDLAVAAKLKNGARIVSGAKPVVVARTELREVGQRARLSIRRNRLRSCRRTEGSNDGLSVSSGREAGRENEHESQLVGEGTA